VPPPRTGTSTSIKRNGLKENSRHQISRRNFTSSAIETSVLLGDFLFTHAFFLASTLPTTYAALTIGKATNAVCEGELRQISSKGEFALSEEDYLSIIEAKTAELCACACQLGAYYAEAEPAVVNQAEQFGRAIGIA
jgi:octaprenyl-diphosphate synthase